MMKKLCSITTLRNKYIRLANRLNASIPKLKPFARAKAQDRLNLYRSFIHNLTPCIEAQERVIEKQAKLRVGKVFESLK